MRPAFTLVLAAALMLAVPAASQQPATLSGLRGAKAEDPRAPAKPPADPPAQMAAPLMSLPAGPPRTPTQLADQCRADCAQAYYFCLASDSPDNCPQAWGQCRQACNGLLPGR